MSDEKNYYRRDFLNPDGGLALVEATVQSHANDHIYAEFTLGDCSRRATLDFSIYSDVAVADRRAKLSKLREVLDEFEAALEQAVAAREPDAVREARYREARGLAAVEPEVSRVGETCS